MDNALTKDENSNAMHMTNYFHNAPHGIQVGNVENLTLTLPQSLDALDAVLSTLPKPTMEEPPEAEREDEEVYIRELCRAYSDKENVTYLNSASLPEEYQEDLSERRIDYFAAESIRKSSSVLKHPQLQGQFDVLKDEMKETVKDIPRRPHANGYDCMLDVMIHATKAPIEEYLLVRVPGWISKQIRRGVCHFLVNEGKLKWVKK